MRAIELALQTFRFRPVHILTDSRDALGRLRLPGFEIRTPACHEAVETVQRIHRLMAGRTVRFSWVRGHSVHPLNECADRLAVAARRGHEARIDAVVQRSVAAGIVAELVAGQVA